MRDPRHLLIADLDQYLLLELRFGRSEARQAEPHWPDNSWVDLVIERERRKRRLRFNSPQQIVLDTGGLLPRDLRYHEVLDVSLRQLEHMKTRLCSWEQDGFLSFYAASIEELPP